MESVYKSGGSARQPNQQGALDLDRPSVISLKIAPETVARYERRGDDLVLVLRNGKEVAVQGFFNRYEGDGRNDLVLEDANGVLWWGQYTSPWSEFHFTEIEWDGVVPLLLPPWLLAGLGVLGLAAAAGGGGGGGGGGFIPVPPVANRPPEAPDHKHTIAEDGVVTGRIGGTDRDGDVLKYTLVTPPGHGMLVINPDGSYIFTPEANYNGPDQFVVTVDDGKGGTTTSTVAIDITPVNDAPVPVGAIPNQAGEDAEGGINVPTAGGFADVDGDTLTYTATGLPPGLTIDPITGVISGTIDPSASGEGPYTVTVTATDPDGESASQTFTWTVTNPAPEARDDAATTDEDTPVSGNVLTGAGAGDQADSDLDGDALVVTQFEVGGDTYTAGDTATIAGIGTLVLGSDGAYTFTPEGNWSGAVPTVTYTISDGEGGTATAKLAITVTPVVDLSAGNDSNTTAEDTPVDGTVVTNDSTISGGTLTFVKATDPANGTVVVNVDGSYTYTPNANFNGTDSFTYTVTDAASGESLTRTVNLTVTPVVDLSAGNDSNTTAEDTPVDGTVVTNDSTISGGTLTFVKATDPANGTVVVNVDGSYTYTPNTNFNGTDSFTYTVTDAASGESLTRTVNLTVTPVVDLSAGNDSNTTAEDTPVDGTVVTNDSTISGGTLTFVKATDPANGTVVVNVDGTYTYTPNTNFNGTDSFTYTVTDAASGESLTQTVNITVGPVSDAPVIQQGPQIATVVEAGHEDGGAVVLGTPTATGTFTATDVDSDVADQAWSVVGTPDATYGSFSIDAATGAWTYTLDNSLSATQALNEGDEVPLKFTVQVADGEGGTAQQTVTITITGTNDVPVAVADTATVKELGVQNGGNTAEAGIPTASGNVLTNDTDVDDGEKATLAVSAVGFDGTPGTVGAALSGVFGSLVLNANGTYTYTLDNTLTATQQLAQGASATEVFSYTTVDAFGASSTSTLTVTVAGTNDQPVIVEAAQSGGVIEAGHTDAGVVVAGTPSATGTFAATDADAGATRTWSVVGTPDTTYGTFAVVGGAWTYILNNSLAATQALNEGDTVPLTFTVRVTDQFGAYSEQAVNITITGTNDVPVAVADTATVKELGVQNGGNTAEAGIPTASGNVLTNDTDVDDGEKATLAVSAVGFDGTPGTVGAALSGVFGSLVLNANGTYTYTLDNTLTATQQLAQGASATEVFSYTTVDAFGASSTSTLTVTVAGTNDQPVITSDVTDAQGAVTEQGTANDTAVATVGGTLAASDADTGATQIWSIVGTGTNGTYGTISIDPATGAWTYTLDNTRTATQALNNSDIEQETFTARVTDEHGAWREQVITVTVNGSNDDVTGLGDAIIPVTEDGAVSGTIQANVVDVDDAVVVTGFKVDADGDGVDEVFLPGDTVNLTSDGVTLIGTLVINANGAYTFTPASNYSGSVPPVSYTVAEPVGGVTLTQTLTFQITPVSDAPAVAVNKTVVVNEDASIGLALTVPTITDAIDRSGSGTGDAPERLGAITLTPGGAGAAGATFTATINGAPTTLVPEGGVIKIVITETAGSSVPSSLHVTDPSLVPAAGTPGVYYLTAAEYAAIAAQPAAESHQNFTVTVGATSYEVDASGAKLPAVAGAASSQVVTVDVQAVTDPVALQIQGGTTHTLAIAEDGVINLKTLLTVAYGQGAGDSNPGVDSDGSQLHWFILTNLPVGAVVNGTTIASTTQEVRINAPGLSTSATGLPDINLTLPPNISGNISGIQITLHVQDIDSESAGIPADLPVTVTLNLAISPVAGEVAVDLPASTPEDTAVNFLAGVRVTDTDGSEKINSVSFTIPTGWVVTAPTPEAGWSSSTVGQNYTITFDGTLSEAQREAVLDAFTIRPPAHSSADVTIELDIETTDSATGFADNVASSTRDVTITVTPVAEQVGTDSDGDNDSDVTINGDHAYQAAGAEDQWFALALNAVGAVGTDTYNLGGPWTNEPNEDGDEFTFAVLTPELMTGTTGETASGSMFRYYDGNAWQSVTYTGSPVWIPAQYLNSLQFMAPPNVSGNFTIEVKAGTVDYDDDSEVVVDPFNPPTVSGPGVSVAVSGSALLTTINIAPVADPVTMALNGRASGKEDTGIPLSITTTSIDPSETFNVTIANIPLGATITYGTGSAVQTFTSTTGNTSFTITDFNNAAPMSITPPLNSNADFTLNVTAVSVDGGNTSTPTATRDIQVSVEGVADDATVTLAPAQTYTEADLDGGATINLLDLVTGVVSFDADGSEAVSVRITGLPEGFTLTGATLLQGGTGTERVWTLPATQMGGVEIKAPANYSGNVSFQVAGVTTENDGDSETGTPVDVSFTVTPSAEGTATTSATLVEDVVTSLQLGIVQQNSDADEQLGRVFIAVGEATGPGYTLYYGAQPLANVGLTTQDIGGVTYYVIPANQVGQLGAQGSANLDGNLGAFDFKYEVIDSAYGLTPAGSPDLVLKDGTFTLSATPVTDDVDLSITGITGAASTSDSNPNDDVTPNTAVVDAAGTTVTVNLNIASVDNDGSERVMRVLIEGVPDGVTVNAPANGQAHQVNGGTWVLVFAAGALPINAAGGITLPVEFVTGVNVAQASRPITMTVQTQDRGELTSGQEEDSVTWNLVTTYGQTGESLPPTIEQWEYNGAGVSEDLTFSLSDVVTAAVTVVDGGVPNIFTVSLTDLPVGTQVQGMVLTSVNGVPTWTATVVVPAGANDATVETALEGLLAGIQITPPANSNLNNALGAFNFNATLTASAQGSYSVSETIPDTEMVIPVTPVTDAAVITVSAVDAGENPVGGSSVSVTIDVSNPVDGANGVIVGGLLYVQVSATGGNAGGTLTYEGDPVALTSVTGVLGVPDGDYHVVNVGPSGDSVNLVYTPPAGTSPGNVVFTAWANTQENNAANEVTRSVSDTATISAINNGVTVTSTPVTGVETDGPVFGNAIELTGLAVALIDNDGSEAIDTILLAGVPVGFLVYVEGELVTNAGGDGITNTWVISDDGDLGTVFIAPPAHWSGVLDDLKLVVESGELTLSPSLQVIDLAPVTVTPVASGLTLDTTQAIGRDGQIIGLNLNAAMNDPVAATSSLADSSTETVTVQFRGLGEYAAFYVGSTLLDTGSLAGHTIGYDSANDTYTITGLTQDELDTLGFKQAASALTDQDSGTAGTQVAVTAWTVERDADGNVLDEQAEVDRVSDTLNVNISAVQPTSGAETFIWGGNAKPIINGGAGEDTVELRLGEDVTGANLGFGLRNIEVLDLSAEGENAVLDLRAADVLQLTDSLNILTINGTSDDSVQLGGGASAWTVGASSGGYTDYTSVSGGSLVTVRIDDDINHSYV